MHSSRSAIKTAAVTAAVHDSNISRKEIVHLPPSLGVAYASRETNGRTRRRAGGRTQKTHVMKPQPTVVRTMMKTQPLICFSVASTTPPTRDTLLSPNAGHTPPKPSLGGPCQVPPTESRPSNRIRVVGVILNECERFDIF